MKLRQPNSFRQAAQSRMHTLLILLVVIGALDLTRRFVALYRKWQKPPVAAVQPAEPQFTNTVAAAPAATVQPPLPPATMTPAVAPAPTAPPPAPAPVSPPAMATLTNNPSPPPAGPGGGRAAVGKASGDILLAPGEVPVTFFSPWAITPIALPGDDEENPVAPTPAPGPTP